MKLVPVTKIDERNIKKKFENDVMSANSDVIVIFRVYCQFGATQNLDSGSIASNTYIYINSNLLSYKN